MPVFPLEQNWTIFEAVSKADKRNAENWADSNKVLCRKMFTPKSLWYPSRSGYWPVLQNVDDSF